ncbi:MAG: GNAT family N-acetyltransferase [Clostridia bacterium]|nr:GNAT family N-acetyltransferase [Clostridia bacterium]
MKLTLETERLVLRPFREDDAEAMFRGWTSDPEVTEFLTWETHRSADETRGLLARWVSEYEKPERLNFAIEQKETGALIGGIDVVGYLGGVTGTPVIGYNLAKRYWGRGYMTEACRAVLDLLFLRGYRTVRIDAMEENVRSIRVIEKCGGRYLRTDEEYTESKKRAVKIRRYEIECGGRSAGSAANE